MTQAAATLEGTVIPYRRPNQIFTVEVLADIRSWVTQGLTAREIADKLNTTESSVRTTCSKHGISLNKDNQTVGVSIPMSRKTRTLLFTKAREMKMRPSILIQNLLDCIARDNLYHAVLDDDDTCES